MSDTTNPENATESEMERLVDFLSPEVRAAREAGIPEVFDDNTAVFIHRTATGGGFLMVAFDPIVLVRWAQSDKGFRLTEGRVQFLPYGMPVLGVGLEDLDAVGVGEEQENDQS